MRMDMADKIERLRGTQSYASLAKAVGCSSSNMHKIAREGGRPGFALGVKLARRFAVPPEWLADDAADWPPPAGDEQKAADIVRDALEGAGLAGDLDPDEREMMAAYRRLPTALRPKAAGYVIGLAAGGSEASARAAATVLQAGRNAQAQAEQERRSPPARHRRA